jgi:RHS repeat-associated protein
MKPARLLFLGAVLCGPLAAAEITYLNDPLSRRVEKRVDGARVKAWLWADNLRPAAELDAANAVTARFIYADAANVPSHLIKGTDTFQLITDTRGSVRLVVNAQTGEIAQRLDYDECGRVTRDTAPGFHPFGFAGGLYDPDTGLVRFGARDYDARTARWTDKDPIRFAGGEENLYGYAAGDPINATDVAGMAPAFVGPPPPPMTRPTRVFRMGDGKTFVLTQEEVDQLRENLINRSVEARVEKLSQSVCLTSEGAREARRDARREIRDWNYRFVSDSAVVAHSFGDRGLVVTGGSLEGLATDQFGSVKR